MKKNIKDLYNFMKANNTSKVVAEVMQFTDGTICETPRFYLDTGQNIGEYIDGILGYRFKYGTVWLPVYSTLKAVVGVMDDLNQKFSDEFNTANALITQLEMKVEELGYELPL